MKTIITVVLIVAASPVFAESFKIRCDCREVACNESHYFEIDENARTVAWTNSEGQVKLFPGRARYTETGTGSKLTFNTEPPVFKANQIVLDYVWYRGEGGVKRSIRNVIDRNAGTFTLQNGQSFSCAKAVANRF
jgi:hypothetical protein